MKIPRALALGLMFMAAAIPAGALRAQQAGDTTNGGLPLNRGRLRQDDLTLGLQSGNLEIRLVPLDERVLRLLTPDAYLSLHSLVQSKQAAIDSLAQRNGVRQPGIALVTFHALTPNTRFDPKLLVITARASQVRPVEALSLSAAWSNQQLDVKDQAIGLVLFDQRLPVTEPFTVTYAGSQSTDWERRLQRLDGERSRILGGSRPKTDSLPRN